jgi:hypothetical protein
MAQFALRITSTSRAFMFARELPTENLHIQLSIAQSSTSVAPTIIPGMQNAVGTDFTSVDECKSLSTNFASQKRMLEQNA